MTQRVRLDDLTSDQLDDLYEQLDLLDATATALKEELAALRTVARGYCPACGRGDAAPSVADWEQQKQRADQAEASRGEWESTAYRHAQHWRAAEAAIESARALHTRVLRMEALVCAHCGTTWPCATTSALDSPAATGHVYLSTGCHHGDEPFANGLTGHEYCQNTTGILGAKKPARCKSETCGAPCICHCHTTPAANNADEPARTTPNNPATSKDQA